MVYVEAEMTRNTRILLCVGILIMSVIIFGATLSIGQYLVNDSGCNTNTGDSSVLIVPMPIR